MFLTKIFPNAEQLAYVLQEFALSLDGQNLSQSFFILTGAGANGKSNFFYFINFIGTLIKLLNMAIGQYAGSCNITLYTQPRPSANAPSPELIALKGCRPVVSNEPNARDILNLGKKIFKKDCKN